MNIRPNDPIPALRRELARAIVKALGHRAEFYLSQEFGIPQYRMSELNHGNVTHVSAEWLIRRIYRMGGRVTITVSLGDVADEYQRATARANATAQASAAGRVSTRASRNPRDASAPACR